MQVPKLPSEANCVRTQSLNLLRMNNLSDSELSMLNINKNKQYYLIPIL